MNLKKLADYIDNYGQYHTDQNHGGYRKVKPEIFLFHPDVSRKLSKPAQMMAQKMHQETDNDENDSKNNEIFAKSLHCVFI